jgi:transcriptional regulator GlxA family with amidase domain
MARAVNLSPWRLAHVFKAEVGISPLRYLTLVRLQKARQHLETSFLTVREIAVSVGIPNASHFTRSFKAAYGSSPVQHRSTHFRISPIRDTSIPPIKRNGRALVSSKQYERTGIR